MLLFVRQIQFYEIFFRRTSSKLTEIALKMIDSQSILFHLRSIIINALPIFSINVFNRSFSVSRMIEISCKLRAKILIELLNSTFLKNHLQKLVLDNFLLQAPLQFPLIVQLVCAYFLQYIRLRY